MLLLSSMTATTSPAACAVRTDDVPCTSIPPCPMTVKLPSFKVSDALGDVASRVATAVQVCHEPDGLHVMTEAQDAHVITQWTHCNQPVYINSSTLECFVAPVERPTDNPTWYHEIDAAPSGVLWAGVIHNTDRGNVSGCVDCVPGNLACTGRDAFPPWDAMGFGVNVSNVSSGWREELFVPFALLPAQFTARGSPWPLYRLNFYRYSYPDGPSAAYDNYELSSWSPTHDPSFHVPARFGVGVLVDKDGTMLPTPPPTPSPTPSPPPIQPYGFVDTDER